MGRAVRDWKLSSRTARLKLKARKSREPFWRLIHEGLHLGYRKGERGGVWMARVYDDSGKYRKRVLAHADDIHDSNGRDILTFRQAQEKAKAIAAEMPAANPLGPYTVADALRDYLEWYVANRKAFAATKHAAELHILPKLGTIPIAKLTSSQIRRWRESIAKAPARARSSSRRGVSRLRKAYDLRARQATANRLLTILKAALNFAWRDGRAPADEPWRKVKPFKNVDNAKVRYLSLGESTRLINACAPEFRLLVQAALLTGCRYGELVRMVCSDFNPDSATVLVSETKSGKPRHVYLTDEGRRSFERITAGRPGSETIFLRADGKPWGAAHQQRPLMKACKAAHISPPVSFHILRHTYGSMLAMKGVPLQVIAEALGHADTRITHRHYAHLMPSYVADTIRSNLPTFGIKTDNVAKMKRKKA